MKKSILLIVLIGALALIVVGCTTSVVPPTEQDETGAFPNKTIINVVPGVDTIKAAITAANSGDTIFVGAGTYNEGIIEINKDLTIIGATSKPMINPTTDTSGSGDARGWFRIGNNAIVNFENLMFDGTNQLVYIAVLYQSDSAGGTVENCDFTNIAYTATSYQGRGICNYGQYVEVLNCTFNDIYRIGVFTFNPGAETLIKDCTYTGKGSGNHLDYGIEFGGGGSGTVDCCNISACTGVAEVDESTSAGILATDCWGPGTEVTVVNSTLTGNSEGIAVGYHSTDATVLTAHDNNIIGNIVYGICNVGIVEVDATRNWWGSPTGPNRELPNGKWVGKGDKVSSNIDYKPWSPQPVEFCNDLSLDCTTIQDGTLLTSDGRVITTGYDEWGYDYQAHIFNGGYCDAYRDAEWCHPYRDVQLIMKWDDAWLSNMDCDGDGLLDRHYGFDSYIGSGAWLTNHQWGSYEDVDGKICNWDYFCKIVAAPADATLSGGIWYAADGTEIGPEIWGAFATIQEVENDPCAGISGLQYSSPCGPGLGKWEGEF